MIASIVPACGASRRMGRPKLTLPLAGRPQIQRVVSGLLRGGVDLVLVVVPPESYPGASELAETAREAGASVLVANPAPEDMRATVELGFQQLLISSEVGYEAVLLTPGDALGVSEEIVRLLIEHSRRGKYDVLVPTHQGRRGHPVLLKWSVAQFIPGLPQGLGINALVRDTRWRVSEVSSSDPAVIADLDTPQDLEQWSKRLETH